MERIYETPELEIVMFSAEDIITTTEDTGEDNGTTLPPLNPFG